MIITAITFLVILSILVFVHEFGHYIVARWVGVRVEEFGFGLPPRIFGKKVKGTIYSINALPIGGFVRLAGEDAGDTHTKDEMRHKSEYFWAKSKKQRAAILLAGVCMNFILATVITSFLLVRGVTEATQVVHIEKVVQGSPASQVGLKEQDIVKRLVVTESGSKKTYDITNPDILISTVKAHAGEPVEIEISRGKEVLVVSLVPRKDPPAGEGALGIAITNLEKRKYPWYEAPFRAVIINFERTWQMLSSLANLLYRLITFQKIQSGEVAGPVGIAQVTGQAVKYGLDAVLEFASILSLNLALLNVLPFPALDGGRLLFVVFEKFGKKTRPDIERTIHQIGMMFLLGLLVLITINDVVRLATH